MNINPIRGIVTVNLNDAPTVLRFNNNSFRIVSQKRKITMTQLFKLLADQDQMLDLIYDLIEASYRNHKAFTGMPATETSEQLQAWIGELSDGDMTKIMEALSSSVQLKPVESGNAMAPANP